MTKLTFVSVGVGMLLTVFSCTDRSPRDSLSAVPESTFVNYYADWLVLQEEIRAGRSDSISGQQRIDSLDRAYNVTEQQIRETKEKYRGDLEAWRVFFDKVTKRLEQMQREATPKPTL